ncbi:MAG: putative Glycosyl hydrolase, family 13 [Candidatus Peribacteria bacterium]|nr:putative Glycosyl hydrolase, family 13 [Candidatus Peribacteria bacterium]
MPFTKKKTIAKTGPGKVAVKKPAAKKKVASKKAISGMPVTFNFYAPAADSIHVGGMFNNWSETKDKLKKGKDGTWTITKNLEPGRYEYLFYVNGMQWELDPSAAEAVTNDFGTLNAVLYV